MDITSLLDAQGIDWVDKGSDEIAIICPNQHNHQGGVDSNPSFNINISKLVGHCLSCGYKLGQIGLTNWLMGDGLDEMQMQALKIHSTLRRLKEQEQYDFRYEDDEFNLVPPSTPFREDGYRGISAATYEALDARHCTVGRYADRVFFKIWQQGKLLGIDARALLPELKPKYLRNKGANAKLWLWPQDYWAPRKPKFICLGEGCFHAVRGVENGTPLLCFYGSNNYSDSNTLDLLRMNLDYVVYFGDNDKAGIAARNEICPQIAPWLETYYVPEDLLPEGKDAGDLTKEEMDNCLARKVRFR